MPDIMKDFDYLREWETTRLMDRRMELNAGDPRQFSDERLQELLAIARILRTRTVAPKAATGNKKAPAPALDSL